MFDAEYSLESLEKLWSLDRPAKDVIVKSFKTEVVGEMDYKPFTFTFKQYYIYKVC